MNQYRWIIFFIINFICIALIISFFIYKKNKKNKKILYLIGGLMLIISIGLYFFD